MKQWTIAILCACLVLAAAGCSNNNSGNSGNNSSTASQSEPETSGLEPDDNIDDEPGLNSGAEFAFEDDHLQMLVSLDREEYTHNDIIQADVTVTNRSDETVVFVKGSGSNIIPDDLTFDLGGLAGLFYPEVGTMDYQTQVLSPGESMHLELPFAPYTSNDADIATFGLDRDLDFFREGDFTPAEPGEIRGKITLSYTVLPNGEDFDEAGMLTGLEDMERVTLEGEIHTTIAALEDDGIQIEDAELSAEDNEDNDVIDMDEEEQ